MNIMMILFASIHQSYSQTSFQKNVVCWQLHVIILCFSDLATPVLALLNMLSYHQVLSSFFRMVLLALPHFFRLLRNPVVMVFCSLSWSCAFLLSQFPSLMCYQTQWQHKSWFLSTIIFLFLYFNPEWMALSFSKDSWTNTSINHQIFIKFYYELSTLLELCKYIIIFHLTPIYFYIAGNYLLFLYDMISACIL